MEQKSSNWIVWVIIGIVFTLMMIIGSRAGNDPTSGPGSCSGMAVYNTNQC